MKFLSCTEIDFRHQMLSKEINVQMKSIYAHMRLGEDVLQEIKQLEIMFKSRFPHEMGADLYSQYLQHLVYYVYHNAAEKYAQILVTSLLECNHSPQSAAARPIAVMKSEAA